MSSRTEAIVWLGVAAVAAALALYMLPGCTGWGPRRLVVDRTTPCYRDCVLASTHIGSGTNREFALNDCAVELCGGKWVDP